MVKWKLTNYILLLTRFCMDPAAMLWLWKRRCTPYRACLCNNKRSSSKVLGFVIIYLLGLSSQTLLRDWLPMCVLQNTFFLVDFGWKFFLFCNQNEEGMILVQLVFFSSSLSWDGEKGTMEEKMFNSVFQ